MFKFPYVDPKELNIRRLLKPGEATFTVTKVEDKDKFGNPLRDKNQDSKIKMTLKLVDSNGMTSPADEYLVGSYPARIYEFALSVGLPGLYSATGFDPSKLVGLTGSCIIKNEEYTGHDGNTRESTKVAMFLVADQVGQIAGKVRKQDPDDGIPF